MSVRAISAEARHSRRRGTSAKRYLEKTVALGKQQAAAVSLKLPTSYVVKQDIGGAQHNVRRLTVSVFERAVESLVRVYGIPLPARPIRLAQAPIRHSQ
jgi:hypothetical protein